MTPVPGREEPPRLPLVASALGSPRLPFGPLEERLDRDLGPDATFDVTGRRLEARGDGTGLREVWAYPFRLEAGPRIVAAGVAGVAARGSGTEPSDAASPGGIGVLTPLGAERPLAVGDAGLTERVVVARDAPVMWLEWTADREVPVTLEWVVGWAGAGEDPDLTWEAADRGLRVVATREGAAASAASTSPGPQATFALSHAPESMEVESIGPGAPNRRPSLGIRARVRVPGPGGLRMAVVMAGPGDDTGRLHRVADRTRVALTVRAGAADRALKDGLRVSASDPAMGSAVDRQRVGLAFRPTEPVGPWTLSGLAGEAMDHLAAGGFAAARQILAFLARHITGDGGIPDRGVGPEAAGEPGPGAVYLQLLTRYLAWTGDRTGVRETWPAALRVVGHEVDGLPPTAIRQLAVVAEEIGDPDAAAVLRDRIPETTAGEAAASGTEGLVGTGASALGRAVREVLGAEPDATRGRLVLRPRPPEGWTRFEARGLAVGAAAVDVVYERDGTRHRLRVRQNRGAAPLQLVLEPELVGGGVAGVRVDGAAAELDPVRIHEPDGVGRWRVPVQLTMDHDRTLEVEVRPD